MALVKIEKFTGSLIGNIVTEGLETLGIVKVLNTRKYTLEIVGIQEATPKGFIEDEPKSHVVKIGKIVYIGKRADFSFVKGTAIDKESEAYKNILEQCKAADLNFGVSLGNAREEVRKITVDKDGCWYRHSVEVTVNQGNEPTEDYVRHLFDTVANMVVLNN